jgi:hypothetical protein
MIQKKARNLKRGGIILYIVFAFLFVLAGIQSGCTKGKAPVSESKRIDCVVSDKLPGDIAKPVEVKYEKKIKFLGTTVEKNLSQNQLKISYYWQIIGELGQYKQIFIHFTDIDNNVLFQNDHEFCPKQPFSEIKNKFIKETFIVGIPQSARDKEINIKVGVYIPDSKGALLKIESSGGAPIDNNNTRAFV